MAKKHTHVQANTLHQTFLLLGSNLGQRLDWLSQARSRIQRDLGEIKKVSHIYESEAWGLTDQSPFLNQAVEVLTYCDPMRLLDKIRTIEEDLARVRRHRWGPRTIDIDILLYDREVVVQDDLIIPHKLMHKRRFVLVPLAEIAASVEHPVLKQNIDHLLHRCQDKKGVSPYPTFHA